MPVQNVLKSLISLFFKFLTSITIVPVTSGNSDKESDFWKKHQYWTKLIIPINTRAIPARACDNQGAAMLSVRCKIYPPDYP